MTRSATRLGLLTGALLLLGAPVAALGQGNIFNPYGNSGYADYREFGSPKYSTDPGLPGQARIAAGTSGSRYNTFDEFTNSLDGSDLGTGAGRVSSSRLPFYRAYQFESQQARRASRPSEANPDQAYRARVAERNNLYFKALNTADPKERTRLLREVDRLSLVDSVDRNRPSNAPPTVSNRSGQAANRTVAPTAPRSAPAPVPGRANPLPPSASVRPGAAPPRSGPAAPATPAPTLPTTPPAASDRTPAPAVTPLPSQPEPAAPTNTNPASVPVPAPG